MAHVPASHGARYGPPSAGEPTAYQPPQTVQYDGNSGWDTPTHTVSAAYTAASQQAPGNISHDVSRASSRDVPRDVARAPERGAPGWLAVVVLIVIASIGGSVDLASGSQVRGGFNIGIVAAAVVAILIVRRRSMFPVVVAPPLVYFAASAVMLYARSGGLHDRKVLLDAAANWLVYGFPAIAGATAAVLIIAGIRMFAGR